MRCEILTDPETFPRGTRMLQAMIVAAPIPAVTRTVYQGDCELLMLYGSGHPVRRPWWRKHVANGGRVIAWDLGYWHRRVDNTFHMRCTLDADHPQAFIRPEPVQRWQDQAIELHDVSKPEGHVLIAGMGPKSNRALGLRALEWEIRAARAAKAAYPGRRIIYKPKRPTDPVIPGFITDRNSIESALRGASLVICRHSNVAVDACIAGVPVYCEDGAAAALYGAGSMANPIAPTVEQRLAFLRSLAYWQYKPEEAGKAWAYLLDRIKNG